MSTNLLPVWWLFPQCKKAKAASPDRKQPPLFLLFKLYSTTCLPYRSCDNRRPILSEKCLSAEPYGVFVFFSISLYFSSRSSTASSRSREAGILVFSDRPLKHCQSSGSTVDAIWILFRLDVFICVTPFHIYYKTYCEIFNSFAQICLLRFAFS